MKKLLLLSLLLIFMESGCQDNTKKEQDYEVYPNIGNKNVDLA